MRVPNLQRRHVAALVVAALVLFAGCSGFDPGEETTTGATETTDEPTTTTTTTEETTTTTTTEGEAVDNESDGNPSDADMSGTMTVLLGGAQVGLTGDDGPVTFSDGDRQWFTSESDVTVAGALEAQGVEVTDASLTYEGTTYDGAEDGTTVEVRVNGESVDPTEHTLQDGDSVWIFVDSDELDIEPPGEYLGQATDHQHGTIEVVVDGETLDLTEDRYQHAHDYFHLEGGDGETWHAHTWQATFGWALSTLDINVTADSVTIEDTTYDRNDGTTVEIAVNGEHLENPQDYRLKDGDQIRIVVDQSG